MHGWRSLSMAVIAAIALASFVSLIPASDAEIVDPTANHPDADFIISSQNDRSVEIYHHTIDPKTGAPIWEVRKESKGSDVILTSFSTIEESLYIVFDGTDVGDLILVLADDVNALNVIDIRFEMYSGSVKRFMLMDVEESQQPYLNNLYEGMFNPLGEITVELFGGNINIFDPTDDMLEVENFDVRIHNGVSIGAFYPTGHDGKYDSLRVTMDGGRITYMTNIRSRISELSYDLRYGYIAYLCIGADTENSGSNYLFDMCTSCVTGNVDVHISPYMDAGSVIIGGGVLGYPRIFSNGTSMDDVGIRNVVIDAPGRHVAGDTCFLNEFRTLALHFKEYSSSIGSSMGRVSSKVIVRSGVVMDVYGENGLWTGNGSMKVRPGSSLFINADLAVASKGDMTVMETAELTNTGTMTVLGDLFSFGKTVNNGSILVRNGNVTGQITGSGYCSQCITNNSSMGSINVMVMTESIIIEQPSDFSISSIQVYLNGGDRFVLIKCDPSHNVKTKSMQISLRKFDTSDKVFDYRFDVFGIPEEVLDNSTITVCIPIDYNAGNEWKSFTYDDEGKLVPIEPSSFTRFAVTFDVQPGTVIQMNYMPNIDPKPRPIETLTTMDFILIAVIAALMLALLHLSFNMRRRF